MEQKDRSLDLSWNDVVSLSTKIATRARLRNLRSEITTVGGVPRGGVIPAAIIAAQLGARLTTDLSNVDPRKTLVVDDIIDSGRTMLPYVDRGFRCASLCINEKFEPRAVVEGILWGYTANSWVNFPWEQEGGGNPVDAVARLLQFIGEDISRDGLKETPMRVTKALKEMTSGYEQNAQEILSKTFSESSDEMVVLSNIDFVSLCEHHMLPFVGVAHVGYIPRDKVVGISKLARVVDCFSRRLQIQERMTNQIATAVEEALQPLGVGVVIEAHHQCMSCRGVKKSGTRMTTSAMLGAMRDKPEARAEFMALARRYRNE